MGADPIDFAADAAPAPADKLEAIVALVAELDAQRRAAKNAADVVSRLQAEVDRIETKALPDAMAAAGVTAFTLTDGRSITVEREVHCGITGPQQAAAYEWLRTTGNDSIIKHTVGVRFGRGQDADAAGLLERLKEQFPEMELVNAETIHPQTLKAFVKECVREGTPIPEQPFGIFKINRAIIRSPKK